ncbi:MAG: hypothetical protein KIPDCIKN_03346 [Haliscomenobacter sp.]|nr:hypothetical protein [Haliscomenobacter sp.]
MKLLLRMLGLVLCLFPFTLFAQNTGDLAFVGFDADGNDNFAIVTFVELPANKTLYFADRSWSGTAFATNEGSLIWNTGSSPIPAGTVIAFYNTSTPPTTSVTRGTVTSPNIALSASSEGIFLFIGTDSISPTKFLAAVGNASVASAFGTLDNTGLSAGSSAIVLTAGIDVGVYTGPRTGLDASGYLAALNDIANNWIFQDGTGNQDTDGIPPDIPFDTTHFVLSLTDNTAPAVAAVSIESAGQWNVRFSEGVTNTATNPANYLIQPALTIDSVVYDAGSNTVKVFHFPMDNGVDYTLTVSNIADAAGNIMPAPFASGRLVYNTTNPALRITEIMYNPPAAVDSLEFIEIYNAGSQTAVLGGLELKDLNPQTGAVGQINLVFPSMTLSPGEIVLVAPDGEGAKNFFVKDFIDLGFIGNALGNGGEALVIRNSVKEVIDSVNYDDVSPWPTSPDGAGPSLELKRLDVNANDGANWKPSTMLAGQVNSVNAFASPGVFVPQISSSVSFEKNSAIFTEGLKGARVQVKIDQAPQQDVKTVIEVVNFTAKAGQDFTLLADTLVFPKDSSASKTLFLDMPENALPEPDRYFGLRIQSVDGGLIGDVKEMVAYIKDNDQPAISPAEDLTLSYSGSFAIGSGASAEIVAYDPGSKRLFVVNSLQNKLEILSFGSLGSVGKIKSIDMSAFGIGIQSVASQNGLIAAAVDGPNFGNGKAVFFNKEGEVQAQVEVGNLPDMITFTPDGKRVLTANEGQPNSAYTIDPEGSVSVINLPSDIKTLQQSDVTTVEFNAFDAQIETLRTAGVRIFGPNATVSKDLEPEYITFSEDGKTAYVTLQENNALAVIDLQMLKATAILPLGYKDHSLPQNALDVSDQSGEILFANYPILGAYMPDGIASFTVGGKGYLITANEGDARAYDPVTEELRFGFVEYVLDSAAFPNGSLLKQSALGRLTMTNQTGDTDKDGDFDKAYVFGGRSFSIWDSEGKLVFDSGDQFERITSADATYGPIFNASNDNLNRKNRSDNKGPEPEGVATALINGAHYAFISLERIGGVMVYNISNPQAPYFVQYLNNRGVAQETGDLGPEGIIFLSAEDSPNDTAMVIVANEISGTLTFYSLEGVVTSARNPFREVQTMRVFPNPASDMVFLESISDYQVIDQLGRVVLSVENQDRITVHSLTAGSYVVRRKDGAVAKMVIRD